MTGALPTCLLGEAMEPYTFDLTSGFFSGSGTIQLPGGGSIVIGGGTGYPYTPTVPYPYYGYPGYQMTTTPGWVWIAMFVVGAIALIAVLK